MSSSSDDYYDDDGDDDDDAKGIGHGTGAVHGKSSPAFCYKTFNTL